MGWGQLFYLLDLVAASGLFLGAQGFSSCCRRAFSSLTRNRTQPPALEAWSLNHWTIRQVLAIVICGHLSAQDPKLWDGETCSPRVGSGLRFDPGLLAPNCSPACSSPSPFHVPGGIMAHTSILLAICRVSWDQELQHPLGAGQKCRVLGHTQNC